MARILVAWELGGGLGHLTSWQPLLARLAGQGHRIDLALRDLARAAHFYAPARHGLWQAPLLPGAVPTPRPVTDYADILYNTGFHDPGALAGRLHAWRQIFSACQPDLVLFDHAPTALLAARGWGFARLRIGNGFITPPMQTPWPALVDRPAAGNGVQQRHAQLLATINGALRALGQPPLATLGDLLAADETLLLTFAELDPYRKQRPTGDYLGSYPAPGGKPPAWPRENRPRIFAYLRPFATLPALLQRLAELGHPTLIYAPQLHQAARLAASNLHWLDEHLDLTGLEANVALCNANGGTTAHLLLAGVPLLQLPLNLEGQLIARATGELGAGLAAPRLAPGGMAEKLDRLLADTRYRDSAASFAKRYRGGSLARQTEALYQGVTKLLP